MNPPLQILRETEFYQGFIRFKMSITNESPLIMADVILDFYFEEALLRIDRHEPDFQLKNGKIFLGNIHSGESKSVAVYFDPLMCSRGTEINCQVTYRDAGGMLGSAFMEPKMVSVVCPILNTDSDINIGRLKEFIEVLPSRDSKVYEIQSGFDISRLVHIAREVVEKHDVRHIRTLHTKDKKECEVWYYGKTKVHQEDIVIKLFLLVETQSLELFAASERTEVLTGLLAEVGRNLKNNLEARAAGRGNVINLTIKDSVIQRSSLLDHCDMDEICSSDIVVEKSMIQHAGISPERGKVEPGKTLIEESSESEAPGNEREELERLRKELEELQRQREEKENLNNEIKHLKNQKMEEEERVLKEKEYKVSNIPKTLTERGIKFVLIPAGDFMMGSNASGEEPIHKVTIENPFYLGKYPVTQKQWKALMGSNPSEFKGHFKGNNPVENVCWDDIQDFIRMLNLMEHTDKYRLPSEAEWEYACRAGTTTRYSFGDSELKLGDYAWYSENSDNKTHPVGKKEPNPWGLYDMHGNVWERVLDEWHDNYEGAPSDGSAWEDGSISNRVGRGGGRCDFTNSCRSASRVEFTSGHRFSVLGFRLLREL